MRLLLLVSAGGAIGAGLRFLVNQAFAGPAALRGAAFFPWATLTVNVVGSFLMGLAVVVIAERYAADPGLRAFLMTGILGGFTTFSAFSLDAVELSIDRSLAVAALYVGLSVAGAIGGLLAGLYLARGTLT